jgi:hypothetical protein
VVFAKRPLGTSKGRLVWREPLVWVAAETFDLVLCAALPLALCDAAARSLTQRSDNSSSFSSIAASMICLTTERLGCSAPPLIPSFSL